jgi:ribosomal protein L32
MKYIRRFSTSQTRRTKRESGSQLTASSQLWSNNAEAAYQHGLHVDTSTRKQSGRSLRGRKVFEAKPTDAQERDQIKEAQEGVGRQILSKTRFLSRRSHLEDQLKGALTQSCTCSGQYIPRSQLIKLITPQSVESELGRVTHLPRRLLHTITQPAVVQSHAKVGCIGRIETRVSTSDDGGSATRDESYGIIFAILLMLKQSAKIRSFVEERVCDADLPFELTFGATRLRSRSMPQKSLKCFKKWETSDKVDFVRKQWMFLVPSFDTNPGFYVRHQELRDEHILPFTEWKVLDDGGFGEVYKASIHPGHHAFGIEQVRGSFLVMKRERLMAISSHGINHMP